ncbi:unnamed protein product, partial [Ectocarpus fasciculatus]
MAVDINELLRLEAELQTSRERETSPVRLDAKVNILKYLQVQVVKQFEAEYDDLYYELNKTGGLDCLRSIAPVRPTELLQPKFLDIQNCTEDENLEQQLQFYLADAELTKARLDELVTEVAHDSSKYEVQCVGIKSRESTRRKARSCCDGDVRKVADMARVTVICATPEALKEAYLAIMGLLKHHVLRVKNGFNSDWMPSGYRDVKLNPVVKEHLCEIQLHLREFFSLKGGQHAVYEWARELNVTTEIDGEHLIKNLSPEVTKEMMRLAGENWRGTGYLLQDLQLDARQYDLAEKSFRQNLRDAEHKAREFEDDDSKDSRRALLSANTVRAGLAHILSEQAKYDESKALCVRSLAMYEKVYGPDHPAVATGLNNWAGVLKRQGKYKEATDLCVRSLAIREKGVGPDHPDVAVGLNNWAGLLKRQGKYEEAAPLYVRSLAIREEVYGPDHPAVATGLNNRAGLLESQGKYEEAEPLFERAQAIRERALGPEHADVARSLNSRAGLLRAQGKYEEAGPLYVRSLAIFEKALGSDHPAIATALDNWASLLDSQGNYTEAEPPSERSHPIREKVLGPEHPDMAQSLNNRALLLSLSFPSQGMCAQSHPLYLRDVEIEENMVGPDHPAPATRRNNRAGFLAVVAEHIQRHQEIALSSPVTFQGKYEEAEPLYVRSLAIREKVGGPDHPDVATSINSWAGLLRAQGKYAEAVLLYERSHAIREKAVGPEHPDVAQSLNNRAEMLRAQGKYEEAELLYKRTQEILEKSLGREHPTIAIILNNRATMLWNQGNLGEAEPLYVRAIVIGEKALGPEHPNLAAWLNNRAALLYKQGKYDEAEPLYKRTQEIWEKSLGRDHPNIAIILNNRATMLRNQGKLGEAEPLYVRAIAVGEKALGPEHPNLATWLNNRAVLLVKQVERQEQVNLRKRCQVTDNRLLCSEHPHAATNHGLCVLRTWCTDLSGFSPQSIREYSCGLRTGSMYSILHLNRPQEKYTEANPLLERALLIHTKNLGENHPDTVGVRNELELVREK